MSKTTALSLAAALTLGVGAGAALADAPQPAKPIDAATFYAGRWYEIGRTPMRITAGCVAGTTDFSRTPDGKIHDKDACRQGGPDGKEKAFAGPVTILDPGTNAKFQISYIVFGFVPVPTTYWVLDHGDDWFIASDPSFKNLSFFTRSARPPEAEVKALTARSAALGFDTSKLEFPAQFPPGQGGPGS
jgi:apolipoprotein D and lipocalin family protein